MAIKQVSAHRYEADEDTTLKELKAAGWTSSVKLSRMENIWAVPLLKRDVEGLTGAGIDVLSIHSGPGRKYHYREAQVLPALTAMQEFLSRHSINHVYESRMDKVRAFWEHYRGQRHVTPS